MGACARQTPVPMHQPFRPDNSRAASSEKPGFDSVTFQSRCVGGGFTDHALLEHILGVP